MKKVTWIIGLISTFLVLIGVFFKFQHWPGANICLVLGGGLFAALYSPLLFLDKSKVVKTGLDKYVNVSVMLIMSVVMLGFIFKSLHWPGAGVGIYVGHFLLIILIPVLIIRAVKETDTAKKMNFSNEAVLLILLTAFSFFVWKMTSGRELIETIVSIEKNINNTDSVVVSNNKLVAQSIKSSGYSQLDKVEKARLLSDDMFLYIKNIKNDMLILTEEFKDKAVLDTLSLQQLKIKGNQSIPSTYLFFPGNSDDLSKTKARELKIKLETYRTALLELVPQNSREGLNLGINTDSVNNGMDGYVQWENYTLKTTTLMGSLTVLSKLQLDVRVAEATVINLNATEVIKAQSYEIYKLKNPKENLK